MEDEDNFDGLEEDQSYIPSQVNIKGIVISVLVILSVFGLVEVAVVLRTPPDTGPRVKGSRIKLFNITQGIFQPNNYNATWVSDTELLLIDDTGALVLLEINSSTSKVLVNANVFRHVNSHNYRVSPNRQYLLISHHQIQQVKGQSGSLAQYSVQKITPRSTSPLLSLRVTKSSMWGPQEHLQLVEWAGNGVVMVKDNDIYHQPDVETSTVHRITHTGLKNTIYNGVTDWIYRERIFMSPSALWVSPGGAWMAYVNFNDSQVNLITFPELEPEDPLAQDIGGASVRYPKSGGELPTVILHVYSLQDKHEIEIPPPNHFTHSEYYLSSVSFVTADTLSISWLGRQHDVIIHTLCSAPDFNCTQASSLTGSLPDLGCSWLSPSTPVYSSSLQSFLVVKPVKTHSGFFHQVVLEQLFSTSVPIPLLQGNLTVFSIVAWDEKRSRVYLIGNLPGKPGERHLLSVSSLSPPSAPQCLTCSSSCQFSDIHMSPSASAYVQICQGPDIPYTQLFSLPDNKPRLLLDNNGELRKTLSHFSLPLIKDLTVDLPWSDVPARIRLLMPPGFREYEEFAFPLIVNVDGSPGSQSVTEQWRIGWDSYLASNRDFIGAKIDVRGSAGQGLHFQNMKKRPLGQIEVEDILYVLRYLSENLHYVDSSKVGVYGTDYGGFLAGMVLAKDAKHQQPLINCAISISPVADWMQYDTFFTDRHMGLGKNQTSWDKYNQASLVTEAKNIPPKKLYLVHRPDDLINLEQSMMLSQALIQSGVLFRQQIYLESYKGELWLEHMYKSMEHYLEDLFGPSEDIFQDDYYVASLTELII